MNRVEFAAPEAVSRRLCGFWLCYINKSDFSNPILCAILKLLKGLEDNGFCDHPVKFKGDNAAAGK